MDVVLPFASIHSRLSAPERGLKAACGPVPAVLAAGVASALDRSYAGRTRMNMSQLMREIRTLILVELDLRGRSEDDLGWDEPLFGGRLGLDSLDALQLAAALEERFRVRIPDSEEAPQIFTSISTIADYVARVQNS